MAKKVVTFGEKMCIRDSIDAELEKNMDEVLKIVVMGRACRNSANIKNRQPIGNMFVKAPSALPEFFVEIIEDELNVKKVTFTAVSYTHLKKNGSGEKKIFSRPVRLRILSDFHLRQSHLPWLFVTRHNS